MGSIQHLFVSNVLNKLFQKDSSIIVLVIIKLACVAVKLSKRSTCRGSALDGPRNRSRNLCVHPSTAAPTL